ncbi:MAG: helix-turn-helix domain-containing protein [Clostridia bacterium]|nr:helix-turn-helix domain-containing protein [Clostridia bacterium]
MSKTNTLKRIENLIEYIEGNIKNNITLEIAAEHTGISKYHLHRIFKAITDKSLMEYVRNRKLARSIKELINTDLKIIDIAAEYGFDYEQSYIRSFKNTFNISPAKVRKERTEIQITEKINLGLAIPVEDGIFLEPKIVLRPKFLTVGIKHKIYFEDNLHFHIANQVGNDFFFNHRHKIHFAKNPDVYIALIKFVPNENYKYYIPSIEVSSIEDIPTGMVSTTIPASQYVAFKYIGLHHPKHLTQPALLSTYNLAYNWIMNSHYQIVDEYRFERIDNSTSREDYCEFEIYFPVKEKES